MQDKPRCRTNRLVIYQLGLRDGPTWREDGESAMELSSSPMTERQRNYRANYRHRIAGWYNGWLHVFVIYVIGFTALSIYFANVGDLRWWELGIVPVTFLFANFFEWWIHRLRHAPPVADQGIPRDLQPPHPDASPVLHRAGDALRRPSRLARHVLSALCAGDIHHDVDPAGAISRLADLAQCRLAADLNDDVDVPDLRVHALLLPCRRQLVRAYHARSSTRSGAITPPTTISRS